MASHQLDVLRVPGLIPGVAKFFFKTFESSLFIICSVKKKNNQKINTGLQKIKQMNCDLLGYFSHYHFYFKYFSNY